MPTDDETAAVFDRAADLLERDGWCQKESFDSHGRRCVLAAIDVAEGPNTTSAYNVLQDYLGVEFVVFWNDAPGRTKGEVVAALRGAAAARRAREREFRYAYGALSVPCPNGCCVRCKGQHGGGCPKPEVDRHG